MGGKNAKTGNELVHLRDDLRQKHQTHSLAKAGGGEESGHAVQQFALPQVLQPCHFHDTSHNAAQCIYNVCVSVWVVKQVQEDAVTYRSERDPSSTVLNVIANADAICRTDHVLQTRCHKENDVGVLHGIQYLTSRKVQLEEGNVKKERKAED